MQPVWTMNTSEPRIDSSYRQYVSPFLNVSSSTPPSSTPRCSAIDCARSGCERPANTISRFPPGFSIQWPGEFSDTAGFSRPGSGISAVRLSMLLVDPAFLGLLARGEPGERTGSDIIRDDRTRRNPSVVANADRSIERIVDCGPDVVPDPRLRLRAARLVLEVGGHVGGGDVRVMPDFRVSDVGQMRDLGAGADLGVLDLHERADLPALAEARAGSHVRERADLGAGRDPDVAADHAVRVDRHVGLELDARLDPGRLRVDDRHPREHVLEVDPVAQLPGDERELRARVDPLDLPRDLGRMDGDRLPVGDEQAERVGDVQLPLGVLRLEPVEQGPERLRAEAVDPGVHLAELELLG